jgi:catechol 2,3-dioxygenase-like lactoylglutathione lyase family enzyme
MKSLCILAVSIPLTLATLPAFAASARGEQISTGGVVTVFVSNMDRSVQFYTQTLGLKLAERYGDRWATIDAGPGLTIGLSLASAKDPKPGTNGAMMIGLEINGRIDDAVSRLKARGVNFISIATKSEGGLGARFLDPDGNELYLWQEWQK